MPSVNAQSEDGVLEEEEAAGRVFKGWLDFTVLLRRRGGMFRMKVTVTINLTRLKSSSCRVLLTDLLLVLNQSQMRRGGHAACQDIIHRVHLKCTENRFRSLMKDTEHDIISSAHISNNKCGLGTVVCS